MARMAMWWVIGWVGAALVGMPMLRAEEPLVPHRPGKEAILGFAAKEHPLPPPARWSHIDYEPRLASFIRSRAYATKLGWSRDKQIRDTGAYVKGKYYGTHPAVRCFYSPKVMYWLTGDPRADAYFTPGFQVL